MATLSEARAMVTAYINAEKAVLKNQSYQIKDRTYTRANLSAIRAGRAEWEKVVAQLSGTAPVRVRRVLIRDD